MLGTATGILRKIHTFLHGLIYPPPPVEDDDLAFFDDLAWLQETERMRQDALLFWSESSIGRTKNLSELSLPAKFYEKHTTTLSELGIMNLNALSGAPVDEPKDLIFEPVRPAGAASYAGTDPAAPAIVADNYPAPQEPVLTFIDPLEDLYEPVNAGYKTAGEVSARSYNDLYAVIMRMTTSKKRQ